MKVIPIYAERHAPRGKLTVRAALATGLVANLILWAGIIALPVLLWARQ